MSRCAAIPMPSWLRSNTADSNWRHDWIILAFCTPRRYRTPIWWWDFFFPDILQKCPFPVKWHFITNSYCICARVYCKRRKHMRNGLDQYSKAAPLWLGAFLRASCANEPGPSRRSFQMEVSCDCVDDSNNNNTAARECGTTKPKITEQTGRVSKRSGRSDELCVEQARVWRGKENKCQERTGAERKMLCTTKRNSLKLRCWWETIGICIANGLAHFFASRS